MSGKATKQVPECGFAVRPRYPVGTRFLKNFPGHGTFEGRVTGFDGELYQIYYPADGDSEVFDETGFDHVEILSEPEPHKRPTRPKKPPTANQQQGDDKDDDDDNTQVTKATSCPICMEEYSGDPSDKASGRLPIQAQRCAHVICLDCIQKLCLVQNRKTWVDCPVCKTSKSFNANEPTTCLTMCEMVTLCQNLKQQRKEQAAKVKQEEQEARVKEEETQLQVANEQQNRKRSAKSKSKSAKRPKEEPYPDPVPSSSSSIVNTKLQCSCCSKHKVAEKFSTKQWERGKRHKKKALCRRCEEKALLRKEVGAGHDRESIRIHIAKRHGHKSKFLATVVPWPLNDNTGYQEQLPGELLLDGYTRESWSLAANDCEGAWQTLFLRSAGDKMLGFLKFLQQHQKSAYGTFDLPNGTDGFFVVPFDQPPNQEEKIFLCKYVLGLGLAETTDTTLEADDDGDKKEAPEDYISSSSLGKLLVGQRKTNSSLAAVPQNSVQVSQQLRPMPPPMHRGVSDWFRSTMTVKEEDVQEEDLGASDQV